MKSACGEETIHRFFVPVTGFSPSAGKQVSVSVEGNVEAGIPHLIPNVLSI
jgi:hypothetical protein